MMQHLSRRATKPGRRTTLRWILAGAGILSSGGLATLLPRPAMAQIASREPQIKAACIYNFIKFVDWPERALPTNGTLVIGVLGESPVGSALIGLNGKSVKNRTLVVRQISTPKDVQTCQVVFVGPTEQARVSQIVSAAQEASTLTVGDLTGFARSGGVINFIEQANKVRFEINSAAAEKSKLTISSQLLRLAKVVGG
jgi:hypothetical protein